HGRFYPVTPSRFNDERPYVEPGDLLGEVRNGAASIPVRSPFRGWVMAPLAWEGELVTPGQILLSLGPFGRPPARRSPRAGERSRRARRDRWTRGGRAPLRPDQRGPGRAG